MACWLFLDYITEEPRRCPILDWYGTLRPKEKSDFDALVLALSETEDWDAPKEKMRKYKELDGRHAGLCELILKVEGKNLRPLGVLSREQRQFVFLGGCRKPGLWNLRLKAFDDALGLKGQFDRGRGTTRAHIF